MAKILLSFFTALLISTAAYGQTGIISGELPALKYESKISQKEFIIKTQRLEEVPGDDGLLAYRVRLPSDWVKTAEKPDFDVDLNNRLLGEVTKYVSPPIGDVRALFVVRAIKMQYLISTRDWLLNYMLANGYSPRGFREVNPDRVEVEYVMVNNGLSYVVRSVARRNGDRIVLAEFLLPTTAEQVTREIQIWSMRTFRVLNPDNLPPVELSEYRLLDMGVFYYPSGWQAATVGERSPDAITTQLTKKDMFSEKEKKKREKENLNKQDGTIRTYYLAKTKLPEGQDTGLSFDDLLTEKGMKRGEEIERIDLGQTPDNITLQRHKLDVGDNRFVDYEYWYAIRDTGSHIFVTTMITPAEGVDFLNWARNKATFELISSSLRLNR